MKKILVCMIACLTVPLFSADNSKTILEFKTQDQNRVVSIIASETGYTVMYIDGMPIVMDNQDVYNFINVLETNLNFASVASASEIKFYYSGISGVLMCVSPPEGRIIFFAQNNISGKESDIRIKMDISLKDSYREFVTTFTTSEVKSMIKAVTDSTEKLREMVSNRNKLQNSLK